jgi:hypothetical protein
MLVIGGGGAFVASRYAESHVYGLQPTVVLRDE